MTSNRLFWAVLAVVLGLLQAWDSGAFGDGSTVVALAICGVLVPALAIAATADTRMHFAALAAGFVLLTWARIVSPTSLNALHLSLIVPAVYILFVTGWWARRRMEQKA